jgi:hypothetical protein
VLNEPEAQKALGGDRYVGSMREAVDATLAALSDPPGSQGPAPRISSAETALSPNT